MSGDKDDFSINIGDDLLAEALQAVEKRLYSGEPGEDGVAESAEDDIEILIPGGLDDIEIDTSELDLDLDELEPADFANEALEALKAQLRKALEQNAELESRSRDAKDEARRLALKVKRLSESNAQLKIDVRDGKANLKTWQDMVAELKSSAQDNESSQSQLRAKHKRDLEDATSSGLAKSLKVLLTPIDHIEMSFQHLGEEIEKDTPLHGLKMSFEEFLKTLEKIKLVKVEASPGTPFDPENHEAIARIEDKNFKDNEITEVHRAGYRYGKRLLRAAQVTVCGRQDSTEEE